MFEHFYIQWLWALMLLIVSQSNGELLLLAMKTLNGYGTTGFSLVKYSWNSCICLLSWYDFLCLKLIFCIESGLCNCWNWSILVISALGTTFESNVDDQPWSNNSACLSNWWVQLLILKKWMVMINVKKFCHELLKLEMHQYQKVAACKNKEVTMVLKEKWPLNSSIHHCHYLY